jgi:hypothetical protein
MQAAQWLCYFRGLDEICRHGCEADLECKADDVLTSRCWVGQGTLVFFFFIQRF